MTQQRARVDLIAAVDDLWAAVGELVLIALEDAPSPSDLAVVDDLVDTVSGLQGDVAACRDLLTPACQALPAATLAELQRRLAGVSLRYWRGIRAYESAVQLRSAVRRRGGEWTAWLGSVQESAARCEPPLQAAEAACSGAWAELAEAECSPSASKPSAPPDHLPVTDPMKARSTQ